MKRASISACLPAYPACQSQSGPADGRAGRREQSSRPVSGGACSPASARESFVRLCLEAGMTIKSIGDFLGFSTAGMRYHIQANNLDKVRCPRDRQTCAMKTLSDLNVAERKALRELLQFVPADVVSSWLNLCFRTKRCVGGKEPETD